MFPDQFAAQIISETGADKGADHLYRAAAQEKGKCGACKRCRQSELERGVQSLDLFYRIKFAVQLLAGHMYPFRREFFHETLQAVQLGSIYPRIIQTQRIRKSLMSVKTGVDDGHQSDAGRACDAKLFRQGVHGTSDPPGAGSAGEEHQSDPSDQSGLYRYACLCDRLVLYMSGIVMPVDIHMIWDNIIFYHFDSFR